MAFQGQIKISYTYHIHLNYIWCPGINRFVVLFHSCITNAFGLFLDHLGKKEKKEKRINDSFCSFILATVLTERKCLLPYSFSFSLNLDILHHLAFTPHQRCFHNTLLYNYFYCTDFFFLTSCFQMWYPASLLHEVNKSGNYWIFSYCISLA